MNGFSKNFANFAIAEGKLSPAGPVAKARLASATVALAALLGVIAFMASQMRRQQDVMAQQEQQLSQQAQRMKSQLQRVSSLEKETATAREKQETQSKTMATLNDSLTRLTETNQQMREKQAAEEARRREIDAIKKDAAEMLKKAYRQVGKERIDGVIPEKKIGVFFSATLEDQKQSFLKGIRPKVSDAEYMEISIFNTTATCTLRWWHRRTHASKWATPLSAASSWRASPSTSTICGSRGAHRCRMSAARSRECSSNCFENM